MSYNADNCLLLSLQCWIIQELNFKNISFFSYRWKLVALNFELVFMNVESRIYLYLLENFYFISGKETRAKFTDYYKYYSFGK